MDFLKGTGGYDGISPKEILTVEYFHLIYSLRKVEVMRIAAVLSQVRIDLGIFCIMRYSIVN